MSRTVVYWGVRAPALFWSRQEIQTCRACRANPLPKREEEAEGEDDDCVDAPPNIARRNRHSCVTCMWKSGGKTRERKDFRLEFLSFVFVCVVARTLLKVLESPEIEWHNYSPCKLDIQCRLWQRRGSLIEFWRRAYSIVTVITKFQQLWGRFSVEHACINYCIPSTVEGVLGQLIL